MTPQPLPPLYLPVKPGQTIRSAETGLWFIHNVSHRTGLMRMEQTNDSGKLLGNIMITRQRHLSLGMWSLHKPAGLGFLLQRAALPLRLVPHVVATCLWFVGRVLNAMEG